MYRENTVILTGYINFDPELKATKTGGKHALIKITTDSGWNSATKKPNYTTIAVRLYNSDAEYICKYGKKGSLVLVNGHLNSYRIEGKGEYTEVVAEKVQLFGEKQTVKEKEGDFEEYVAEAKETGTIGGTPIDQFDLPF